MRYALYPGCLILQRMQTYEASTRALLGVLGLPVVDLAEWVCCGGPVVESFREDWFILSAYNLALASRQDAAILTLCGSCTASLRRARRLLATDEQARQQAEERLAAVGLALKSLPEVHHLLQVLDEHRDLLASHIRRRLSARVAVTYPCQVFRPAEDAAFDDPEKPQVMRRLVGLTGAEVVSYAAEYDCCGSTLLMSSRKLALEAGRRKLQSARNVDVMVDACGNCHLLLERYSAAIAKVDGSCHIPLVFISQLLGLAVGLEPKILGMKEEVAAQLLGEVAGA
jgi:heterodisulfide reductase subunit B